MPETGAVDRGISWTQNFPFLRLFRTFALARAFWRLVLALVCVISLYVTGRVLDWFWTSISSSAGVVVNQDATQTEIEVYAARGPEELTAWRTQTTAARKAALERAVDEHTDAATIEDARKKLESSTAYSLISSAKKDKLSEARRLIDEREQAGLAAIDADKTETDKPGKRHTLRQAGDYLRLVLAGVESETFATAALRESALERITTAGTPVVAGTPTTQQAQDAEKHRKANETLAEALAAARTLRMIEQSAPRGPFMSFISYESRCFAAAIRGVCALRLSYANSAMSDEPSLLGSIASAGHGVTWLLFYRPWYALIFGMIALVVTALFGGAICRSAAVQSARDESISLGEALRFAHEKLAGLVLAPVIPLAIFMVLAAFLILGGLLGAIPWIGDVLAGGFYILALLGGFGLALVLIALVLGFNLLWPTIAVEGSDAFDAITHAAGYVGQRIWHYSFYMLVLLSYGGVCFVAVRLIAILLLKLTHSFTGVGMSLFGLISSAETSTISKLDAIWRMPAWSEISILPTTGIVGFWGTFGNAPLGIGETMGYFLISFWVFIIVGLVAAFVLSFYFCGGTMIYILLRKDVDATDFDEIFYDDADELPADAAEPAAAPAAPESKGTPLPVVNPPPKPQ